MTEVETLDIWGFCFCFFEGFFWGGLFLQGDLMLLRYRHVTQTKSRWIISYWSMGMFENKKEAFIILLAQQSISGYPTQNKPIGFRRKYAGRGALGKVSDPGDKNNLGWPTALYVLDKVVLNFKACSSILKAWKTRPRTTANTLKTDEWKYRKSQNLCWHNEEFVYSYMKSKITLFFTSFFTCDENILNYTYKHKY